MVELLAPAGSTDSLRAAVNAGADAVYIGGSMFGARAYADNPDEKALIDGIEYCHLHGRKLYMTVNTLLKEKEIKTMLYDYLLPYYERGVDALIVQDLGVVRFLQQEFPGLEIHASTQMTVTGAEGVRLLQRQGITRVVPARELSLDEIRKIIDETGIEVETFIHGAMCYCYSGQCLFSSLIGGRSGNRGRCAQPCRLPYTVQNGKFRKENIYVLSMKDMCTLDILPELIDAGIASMKIEGRMKRPEYTAGVVSVYRKYIDTYTKTGRRKYRVDEEDRRILKDLYNRGGFSSGYYFMHNGPDMMSMERPNHFGTEALKIKSCGKGKINGTALEQLHKKDVLEITPGNEITLTQDVKKGENVTLTVGKAPVQNGMILNRTKNEWLLQSLTERFLKENCKEKIKGDLRIFAGSPAILKLKLGNIGVAVSKQIAERAENAPTSLETVEKQLKKTGSTPFVFEQLTIDMEENLFVSVRLLNELRRAGIEKLTEEILSCSRRKMAGASILEKNDLVSVQNGLESKAAVGDAIGSAAGNPELRMNVLVTSMEQLDAVLDEVPRQLDTVYLDLLLMDGSTEEVRKRIFKVQQKGLSCFLNFPAVFRKNERKLLHALEAQGILDTLDGFLLHTIDELSWSQEYQQRSGKTMILTADDNFYTYNRLAAIFLKEQGIGRIVLPAELNFRELSALDTKGTELNVYGYQAVMQSAQCVTKNTVGCTRKPSVICLRDRKRVQFPVLNRCNVCCNTIYNSVPLQLGDCREEIAKLAASYVRLSFTIETGSETKRILKLYSDLLFSDGKRTDVEMEGTRGHFRRGVE